MMVPQHLGENVPKYFFLPAPRQLTKVEAGLPFVARVQAHDLVFSNQMHPHDTLIWKKAVRKELFPRAQFSDDRAMKESSLQ